MTTATAQIEMTNATETTVENAAENAVVVNQELLDMENDFKNPNSSARDFEKYTEIGLLDTNLVKDLVDLSEKIAGHANPESNKAEIAKLKKEAAKVLDNQQKTEEAFALLMEIQELEKKQMTQGAVIRAKIGEEVSFKEILVAYQEDFLKLIDSEFVSFLNKHRDSKLRHGKGNKSSKGTGTAPADKKKGPVVVVEFNNEKIEIAEGRGPIPKVLAAKVEEFAKAKKLEVKGIKPKFVEALKNSEIKGVKFVEAKAGEA